MKKSILLFIILLGVIVANAQETTPVSTILSRKNELRVDVVGLGLSRVNLTYERFLNKKFSIGTAGVFSANKKNKDDFDQGNVNFFTKYEIIPFVRYNMSQGARSFYFAEIFTNINGGDFREILLLTDSANNHYYTIEKNSYVDLGIGAAVGYKYYIMDQFGIEFLVGLGSNLFNKDKSPDILSRVGLSVSYRF